jgi:hypothetical protein
MKSRGQRIRICSHRAQGKDSVFSMNQIAPGTPELFRANADGSDD